MIAIQNKNKTLGTCLFLVLLASGLSRVDALTPVILFGLIPLLTFLAYKQNYSLHNTYFRTFSILFLLVLLTYFFSTYPEVSVRNIRQLLGVYLLCYSCCKLCQKEENIKWFYTAYVLCFLAVIYYINTHGLLAAFDFTSDRIASDEDAGMNANEPAYYMFFLANAVYYLGEIVNSKKVKLALKYAFFAMIPLAFVVALLTGARQALIIMIPTLGALTLIRYNISGSKSFLVLLLTIIVAVMLMPSVTDIYNSSILAQRADSNALEDTRVLLLKDAFHVGLENPLLGVGPGCYFMHSRFNGFSHCSYTEMFANSGAIAALIYIFIIVRFICIQWSRYRRTKDSLFLSLAVSGFMYAIYNFFYVFYQSMWMMTFFFLIATHSDTYYKNHYSYKYE